jgi:hypothetical protein
MNNLAIRTIVLILHALLNFIVISYTLDYDITGSWMRMVLFSLLFLTLLYFFVRHIISYVQLIKSK